MYQQQGFCSDGSGVPVDSCCCFSCCRRPLDLWPCVVSSFDSILLCFFHMVLDKVHSQSVDLRPLQEESPSLCLFFLVTLIEGRSHWGAESLRGGGEVLLSSVMNCDFFYNFFPLFVYFSFLLGGGGGETEEKNCVKFYCVKVDLQPLPPLPPPRLLQQWRHSGLETGLNPMM